MIDFIHLDEDLTPADEIDFFEAVRRAVVNDLDKKYAAPPSVDQVANVVLANMRQPQDGDHGRDAPTLQEVTNEVLANMRQPADGKDAPAMSAIVNEVMRQIRTPEDGTNGRDAPEMWQIVESVLRALPKPQAGKAGLDAPPLHKIVKRVIAEMPAPEPHKRDMPDPGEVQNLPIFRTFEGTDQLIAIRGGKWGRIFASQLPHSVIMAGGGSSGGGNGAASVPQVIKDGETFTVKTDTQALYALPISLEAGGVIDIQAGAMLVGVD